MNDREFDQVPKILFNGVDSIVKSGSPGVLIPLTNDTRAVLCGDSSTDVVIVATRFGQGRCLVFGQTNYLHMFTNSQEYKDQAAVFIQNCKKWLSKGLSNEVLEINNEKTMLNAATQGKILVWNGHTSKDETFITDLCKYLESGGALVCGATAWGWLQGNKGKSLSEFSFQRFCDYIGVKLTNSGANTASPILFRPNLVSFKNIHRTVEYLKNNSDDKELFTIIGMAIKEIGEALPGVPLATLEALVMNTGQEIVPAKSCPIKDKDYREQSKGVCNIMCVLPGIKAPGVLSFPGDFDQLPPIETDILCTVESTTKEWHCTGYYVAAGIPIQMDIVKQEGVTGWSARIGCHSDDLNNCSELRRWHYISICKSLTTGTVTLNSAFGGLLFLESPEGGSSSITVNIHNVILTPTYNLSDSDRANSWKDKQENAQGLWADIAGQYIVFNVPSTSVLSLDSTLLDRVLRFWDSSVLAHHELLGTKPTYRERIVCDEQPSVGYMHCGYPVVTQLDVSDPKSEMFAFNIDILEKEGAWGLFHELGHNRQRPWWTFDGTTEVTVNIFTLHAMDKLCHLEPWIHNWLKSQLADAHQYIANGSQFAEWKAKPGVALFIYAQLVREYGWNSYKAVFRKYEATKPILNSDQEKIDYWITTFSKQVGYNLVPLFKFWGFPISQSTIDTLAELETSSISDIFMSST